MINVLPSLSVKENSAIRINNNFGEVMTIKNLWLAFHVYHPEFDVNHRLPPRETGIGDYS